ALILDTLTNHRFRLAPPAQTTRRAIKASTRPQGTVNVARLYWGYPTLVAILAQAGAISLVLIDLVSPQPGPSQEMACRPLYPAYRRCRGAARTPLTVMAHRTPTLARLAQKRERKAHIRPSLLAPPDLVSGPSEPSLLAQQKLSAPSQQ